MAFKIGSALELNRTRYQKPVATLVKSTAIAAIPKAAATTKKSTYNVRSSAQLRVQQREDIVATLPKKEKIEFSAGERIGYKVLIFLNVLGDLADFGIFFAGVGELVSLAFDGMLVCINVYFLGMNPKNKKMGKKMGKSILGKLLIRFGLVEFIPIISWFNLRSWYVYKLYKQRIKLHEEAM